MIYNLPEQMLTTEQKFSIEEGETVPRWFKENRRYFATEASLQIDDKVRLEKLYAIADESLVDINYKHIVNPLNSDKKEFSSMPARLRNYSIIKPVLDRLLGERRKRPNRFEVVPTGALAASEVQEKMKEEFKTRMAQKVISTLQGKGVDLQSEEGQQQQELSQKAIERDTLLTYIEEKAKNAYTALTILNQDLRLEDKFQEAYYDYLVTGRVFDCKSIHYDNVEYSIVSPLEIAVIGWDDTSKFAEDATAVVRTMKWTAASVIDYFRDKLTEDQIRSIKKLESSISVNNNRSYTPQYFKGINGEYAEFNSGLLTVEHVVWKTLTKRGILSYQTKVGIEKMPVGDDYVLNKSNDDIDIEWTWENEWVETYSLYTDIHHLSSDDVISLHYGIGEVQRTMLDNTSRCKLPYNGIVRGYRNNTIVSPVKTGIAYEELINNLHYRFDLALSRSYDKLLLFPLGLIPTVKGWSTDRWMYSLRAFSIAFFDETKEKAQTAIQGMKEIDMSLSNYMKEMWGLIQTVKEEYWQAVGFNPQRFGDINQNSGKGLTDQALMQSVSSTYDMISLYEGFRECSLNALLDYTRFAWIEGKKGAIYNTKNQLLQYDIDGIQHASTETGVFVVNPQEEEEKIQFFKQVILQPLAQNGNQPDLIAEIVDTNNFSKVKELALKSRKINEEYEMQKQQQINDGQQQVAEMNAQSKKEEQAILLQIAQLKANTEIEKALIMADSFNAKEGDIDGDGVNESNEIIDRHYERLQRSRENYAKAQQTNSKLNMENKKMNIKEKEMENKLAIAKENKNKFDK